VLSRFSPLTVPFGASGAKTLQDVKHDRSSMIALRPAHGPRGSGSLGLPQRCNAEVARGERKSQDPVDEGIGTLSTPTLLAATLAGLFICVLSKSISWAHVFRSLVTAACYIRGRRASPGRMADMLPGRFAHQ